MGRWKCVGQIKSNQVYFDTTSLKKMNQGCLQLPVRCNCLSQQHAQLRRLLLSFPKRKLRRQVCTNCVIHETYVSQRLTNLCFSQILSVTHPPAVGLRSRCRPLTSDSFHYAPSLPPFMLPFRIVFDIYIITF